MSGASPHCATVDEVLAKELIELGCGRALGRYTLLRKIATGGMAEVFAARSRGVSGYEKKVAIKKILPQHAHSPKFLEMLVDEAKISASLAHPNIAQVYELAVAGDNSYFLVMEYVDGPPLSRVLSRLRELGRKMPVEIAAHVISEVAKGLDHAHRQTDGRGASLQIVHRDVSPQNVLLSQSGDVKLIDFGIARAEGRAARTGHGIIKGKLKYLAPEIANGDEPDHRADVYCCGLVLFEILAGEPMFTPQTDLEAIETARDARVRSARAVNPAVPEALDEIMLRALRRDRNARFQSAKELHLELRAFLSRAYPSFIGSELADLIAGIFGSEIREVQQIDSAAESLASALEEQCTVESFVSSEPDTIEPGGMDFGFAAVDAAGFDPEHAAPLDGSEKSSFHKIELGEVAPTKPHEPSPWRVNALGGAAASASIELGAHDTVASVPIIDEEENDMPSALGMLDTYDIPNTPFGNDDPPTVNAEVASAAQTGIEIELASAELRAAIGSKTGVMSSEDVPDTLLPEHESPEREFATEITQLGTGEEPSIAGFVEETEVPKASPPPPPPISLNGDVTPKKGTTPLPRKTPPPRKPVSSPSVMLRRPSRGPIGNITLMLVAFAIGGSSLALALSFDADATVVILPTGAHSKTATIAVAVPVPVPPAPAPGPVTPPPAVIEPVAPVAAIEPEDEPADRKERGTRTAQGSLRVQAVPAATIIVDGKRRGKTPRTLSLKPGLHEIVLESASGERRKVARYVGRGKNQPVVVYW